MRRDLRGNPISTASCDAADHAEQALWRLVSFFGDPSADLAAAASADPGWPLAPAMQAAFILSMTEPGLVPQAREAAAQAEALAAGACERERAHVAALRTALAGCWKQACAQWDAILLRHPRDLLALFCAHLYDFYRGDARNLRQRVARVLPEWPVDDPLRPYVLSMHAFGLEECQLYAQAEATGREAASGDAAVPWAIHAVAHVMEMQGRHEEGLRWLADREAEWSVDNGLSVHNWWHKALFHLEALDHAGALAVYDAAIGVPASTYALQRLDAAALLWRLSLYGVDVGDRWRTLADGWIAGGALQTLGYYAFNDVHLLIALVGAGRRGDAEAVLAEVERRAESDAGDNRGMAGEVGVPLMRGLLAYDAGEYDGAAQRLYAMRDGAHRFGGSHAQRDLVDQTILAAAAGRRLRDLGRALLNERRLAKRATPLTERWAERIGA